MQNLGVQLHASEIKLIENPVSVPFLVTRISLKMHTKLIKKYIFYECRHIKITGGFFHFWLLDFVCRLTYSQS